MAKGVSELRGIEGHTTGGPVVYTTPSMREARAHVRTEQVSIKVEANTCDRMERAKRRMLGRWRSQCASDSASKDEERAIGDMYDTLAPTM